MRSPGGCARLAFAFVPRRSRGRSCRPVWAFCEVRANLAHVEFGTAPKARFIGWSAGPRCLRRDPVKCTPHLFRREYGIAAQPYGIRRRGGRPRLTFKFLFRRLRYKVAQPSRRHGAF
jgi:hypothetical protein